MRNWKWNKIWMAFALLALSGCASVLEGREQKTVNSGEAFHIEELEFHPKSFEKDTEIKPKEPQEYYHYYEEEEGYHYYHVSGTVKNNSFDVISTDRIYVEAEVDGKRIDALLAVTDEKDSDFVEEIAKSSEVRFELLALDEEGGSGVESFHIFYNDGLTETDQKTYDHEIVYKTGWKES